MSHCFGENKNTQVIVSAYIFSYVLHSKELVAPTPLLGSHVALCPLVDRIVV